MKVPRLVLVSALVLPVVAGCLGGAHHRPQLAVPAQHRGEPVASDAPVTVNDLRWTDLVHDEPLQALIREALDNNHDVLIAAARVLEARAAITTARADGLPAVAAVAGYSRSGTYLNTPITETTQFIGNLSWEIDFWGRVRNATKAARATLLATGEAQRVIRQTLASSVVQSYYELCDLDLEAEITRRALTTREDSLALVSLRVENGYSSEMDLRQAEALVKSAQRDLIAITRQVQEKENLISFLLGRNPGAIIRDRALLEADGTPAVPPGLPSSLLERRPDLRQAEQELAASEANVAVAKAAYFPVISLTGSSGFTSVFLHNLLDKSNGTWLVTPSATLPLFSGGRIRAGVRAAEARQEQAVLRYRQAVAQAFREVADALANYRQLVVQGTMQQSLTGSLRGAVELANLRYLGGEASYLEYLDSERQVLEAEIQWVHVRRDARVSLAILYRALGGEWP